MSPHVITPKSTFTTTTFAKTAQGKTDFGATIEGLDLSQISGMEPVIPQ